MRSLKEELTETILFDEQPMPEKAVAVHQPINPDTLQISLKAILSLLRAIHWDLHTSHWLSNGAAFYANHGMFSEMYKATEEDYDKVAEKIIGHFQSDLDPCEMMKLSFIWLKKIEHVKDLYDRALKLETTLLKLIQNCLEICQDYVSSGIENMLDDISDQHEKHIYFIKQSIKQV